MKVYVVVELEYIAGHECFGKVVGVFTNKDAAHKAASMEHAYMEAMGRDTVYSVDEREVER